MTNLKNIENAHLSIVERYLLTFIKYKTNNHHPFFMNNESIAQQIGCKASSTKVLINKLIREGYILKMAGKNGRRELALSGKYYVPLDGVNMSNQEKSLLKQDIQNFERMEKQYKQDITELKQQIANITSERDDLNKAVQKIIKGLEKRGIPLNEVQAMIKEEDYYQPTMQEVLPTIEKPLEMIEETPVIVSENNDSVNETQAKINEILAKFKVPDDYSKVML